jgi:hypothetical protein
MLLTGKKIEATESTPEVVLDPNGVIRIKGRAMAKNAAEFYSQIEKWIDLYIINPADLTCICFYLEYLNSANSSVLITLMRKISNLKLTNKQLVINWYYEEDDDDILAHGEKISRLVDIPVNLIMMPEYEDVTGKPDYFFTGFSSR